ncbi:MAG: diacylglycerol O-acyltransferase / wax synthase [Actinomycetota bacterium]|nr:diacylglycerol O-acyltransferase / wax synthase [Actinomycetota bacterium]
MSDEDALMWHVEKDPILRSTIVAVAIFDGTPDFNRLRDRINRATCLIPRLRQRVLSPPFRLGPPRWSVEATFDLDFHLRRMRLPEPGTERALLDLLQPIATAGFDRARPLWEFTLIEGLTGADGSERAAFAMKVHHSVTDGVGGMALLAHLVDLTADAPEPIGDAPASPAPEPMDALGLIRDSLVHSSRRMLGVTSRIPGTARDAVAAVVHDPVGSGLGLVRTAASIARALAPASAPMSPVMRDRGMGRRLDFFDLSLDDIKRAGKATEGSVNDVFVASVLGGLNRYHERHGDCPDALRMTLPINLRREGDDAAGNHFAPARFAAPVTIADPRERVRAIRALVRQQRAEPFLQLTGPLAGVLNRLPTTTTTALFGGMLKCCDFVATNVPGAPVPVYAGGARVDRLYAFAPPAGAAVNVSLISHCDTCCIGLVTDTTAIPDADVLVECVREGFDELLSLS